MSYYYPGNPFTVVYVVNATNNNQKQTVHRHRQRNTTNGKVVIDEFHTAGPCQACNDPKYWSNYNGHARHGR
jgi:hypothetical protein